MKRPSDVPRTPSVRQLATACAMLTLVLSATEVAAQKTMRVSEDGGPPARKFFNECSLLPTPSTRPTPSTPPAKPPGATTPRPKGPLTAIPIEPKLKIVARGVWQLVSPGVVNFCVRAGVINEGATASTPPVMLSLSDTRKIDHSYRNDYKDHPRNMPSAHLPVKTRSTSIPQPIAGGGEFIVADAWCEQSHDWRKRPVLGLALTGAGVANQNSLTTSCHVDFGEPLPQSTNLEAALRAR